MLKKLILFLFLLNISLIFSEDGIANQVLFLQKDSNHYIYENVINIREAPSTQSKSIGQAYLGDKVIILEQTDKIEEIYGYKACWYLINIKDIKGYVWGGLISVFELSSDFDMDGKTEILLCRTIVKKGYYGKDFPEYMAEYNHSFKLIRDNTLITDKPFLSAAKTDDLPTFNIFNFNIGLKLYEKCGFDPEINLLEADCSFADAALAWSENFIFYWNGKNFTEALSYKSYFLYDRSENCLITFPKEHKQKNFIIIKSEKTTVDKDGKINTDKSETKYIWNGKSFILK